MPDPGILERNLAALRATSPDAARAVADAAPHPGISFAPTDDGVPTATLAAGGTEHLLASSRRPRREAERLAESVDPRNAATVAVLGFGLGYHVRAIADRIGSAGLVLCFEPDVPLLRAVLERVDCSDWLGGGDLILVHDAGDASAISRRLHGLEGALALGVQIIAHPPSVQRLGDSAAQFSRRFTEIINAAKTSIVTTLMQSEQSMANALRNARAYASQPGVEDLRGALAGTPAIVVSAGPSLAESIDALAKPEVRERACIIAAQTVLHPLLEAGVRPHFVTALDYHEISRRFYEQLTPDDVEGVTLVAEPKANPAIINAWPGAVRLAADGVLERLLNAHGVDLGGHHAELPAGATVAHLSYYLARFLGCDPVILVGQDLAYTDGLYYGAGAAIHRVWAAELGDFRTLEMMELERILRARHMLRQTTDREGRTLYTDEQLQNYLVQFERDFATDAARGLSVIDAGRGAAKAHAEPMNLNVALAQHPAVGVHLPPTPADSGANDEAVDRRLREIAEQARQVGRLSLETLALMKQLDPHGDAANARRLVGEIHAIRDRVEKLHPAYWMAQYLNQTGGLRRARADRAIALEMDGADPREVQARRAERDADNLQWLADTADRLARMLEDAASGDAPLPLRVHARPPAEARLPAVVWFDPRRGGLFHERDLLRPIAGDDSIADVTLRSLARCDRVSDIVLVATDVDAARRVAARTGNAARMHVRSAPDGLDTRRRWIAAARAFSPASFRGGLASLTPHDECFDAATTAAIIREFGAPGALVLAADWALVDPALTDAVAERMLEDPDARHVAFAQVPAGLAACALALPACDELAMSPPHLPGATIGGLLAYLPHAARTDPIARPICVTTSPPLRDLGRRLIPDSPDRAATLAEALHVAAAGNLDPHELPDMLGDALQRPAQLRAILGEDADEGQIDRVVAFARGAPDAAITLDCRYGGYAEWVDGFVHRLVDAGAASVHVRTLMAGGPSEADRLARSAAGVISVDIQDPAFPPPFDELRMEREDRPRWIVPRLRRTAATLEQLPERYAALLARYGAAVVDPPAPDEFERLRPLPLPRSARRRLNLEIRQTKAKSVPAALA
ncbi:MAG: 6-hydroxymethylpterin diphosphokinase MptE-like protein [Planctomycetota bacterium]